MDTAKTNNSLTSDFKSIETNLKNEIDKSLDEYNSLQVKLQTKELTIKEIQETEKKIRELSEKIEFKINLFLKARALQQIDNNINKNTTKEKIFGDKSIELIPSHFENIRNKLQQNQIFDLEDQKKLKKKLNESENLKKALDESSIISITDKDGVISYVNKLFEEISEYNKNEVIGKNHRIIKSNYHSKKFFEYMWKVITKGYVWKGAIQNKTKSGRTFWIQTTIVPVLDKNDNPEQFFAFSTDITKEKELEIKLSKALDEIRKADDLKNEFASMITHELKTPLTPIRGYCEILKEGSFGMLNKDQEEFINIIENNSIRLERLIGDVLDVQKLSMGKMTFNIKPVNLGKFFKRLEKDVAPLLSDKQIEFSVPKNVELNIMTDKIRLQEVLENFIRNSIDFVPQKGKIEIDLKNESEEKVIVSVRDNGTGIPKENQPQIFKKFFQGDTSRTRKHGGTGLGIVVCKGIIENLGGKIWFESQEGIGTCFYFSLPINSNNEKLVKN